MTSTAKALEVVVAPDSFKGTATAAEAASSFASGWRSARPHDSLVLAPMADGGEGTIDTLAAAVPRGRMHAVTVDGPVDGPVDPAPGRPLEARWLELPGDTHEGGGGAGSIAVVELAESSGITLLPELAPLDAHTRGFGQVIRAALDSGAHRVLLAIGGSASTDGGAGMLSALGARLTRDDGLPIAPGGRGLADLASVDIRDLVPPPAGGAAILGDVTNPLLGVHGAAAVFGPQKGADARDIAHLDAGLARLAGHLGFADPSTPGAGAAGGTGFGLIAWGATMTPGARAVADAIGLAGAIRSADVVVTGEGRFDGQSADGKVPSVVAELARAEGARILLVAGSIDADASGFDGAVSLAELAGSGPAAMDHTLEWIRAAGRTLALRSALA
ncbi:glycerate kinase [Marisediminicola sp. LYQ85]|uniref:glycerate kinase n=1 Tax=Marisediminicola sp. LYQ85 TaxID=3391062 RepID=UPI0039832D30